MEFYGYRKCSTCRNAYKYLQERGIDIPFHDFVADPPSPHQLRAWIERRGEGVTPFINTKGQRYRELGLKDKQLGEEEWLEKLSQDGRLLKRPVLVTENEVVIGFDREAYDRIARSQT
jgi:arsenate reductase